MNRYKGVSFLVYFYQNYILIDRTYIMRSKIDYAFIIRFATVWMFDTQELPKDDFRNRALWEYREVFERDSHRE